MKTIAKRSGDVYIPRGVSVPALDKDTLWEFTPKKIGTGENIVLFIAKSYTENKYYVFLFPHILFYSLDHRRRRPINW